MVAAYESEGKRVELVRAAKRLLHEQGYARTSLADVATAARVPLGNVYYYFRTKDLLAEAVISSHEAALREQFSSWEVAHDDPRERLTRLVRSPLEAAPGLVRFGCPHGSLCQELEKLGPNAPLAKAAARLLGVYIDWTEGQLRAAGVPARRSRALAASTVAAIQGAMLVAHTMRSEDMLAKQLRHVEGWLHASISGQPRSAN
jgi:TetR/AcrR family transcriptional repressor of nem operon